MGQACSAEVESEHENIGSAGNLSQHEIPKPTLEGKMILTHQKKLLLFFLSKCQKQKKIVFPVNGLE